MKIKKRQQPVDLQSLDGDGAPTPVGLAEAAAADQAFAFAPPPSGDLTLEAKTSTPAGTSSSGLAPRIPVTRTTAVAPSSGWTIYMAALVVSVLWACAPIAFAWGYRRSVAPFDFEPFAVAVFAALAIGPAALVWALAYMVRQGQLLGAEARRTKALADEMVTPAMAAGAQTVDLVHAMREEIARAGAAAQEARDTIIVLRQALAGESEELAAAAANAARTAQGLSETLGRERSELGGLAQTLDSQAAA
ncbi:MAG: hypothetical protein ACREEO_13590, partial [Phenylobacterium sp.]